MQQCPECGSHDVHESFTIDELTGAANPLSICNDCGDWWNPTTPDEER